MATFEFDESEIELLVESLRNNEKHSRLGFSRWLAANLGSDPNEKVSEKVMRATLIYERMIRLRAKLGDTQPIHFESR